MNSYFYLCVLCIFGCQKSSKAENIDTYDLKDDIKQAIESLREQIPEVINFSAEDIDLSDDEYISGDLVITEGRITGLKEFIADIKYTLIIPTGFTITLESISVYLEYLADLVLFNIPLLSIFGEGPGRVEITNFTVDGKIAYKLSPLNLSINSVHINLDDAQFNFEGLLNDTFFTNLVNDALDNNVAKIINENEGAISSVLEDVVNALIRTLLPNSTTTTPTSFDNGISTYNDDNTEKEGILKVFETLIEAVKSMIS